VKLHSTLGQQQKGSKRSEFDGFSAYAVGRFEVFELTKKLAT
jgi:hypothetical protein